MISKLLMMMMMLIMISSIQFLTPAAINDSMRAQNFLNHMASGNSIGLSSSQGHGRQNLDDASVLN